MHKAFLVFLRSAFAVLVVCATLVAYLYTRDESSKFIAAKGHLERVRVEPIGADSLFERSWLTLESSSGLRVVSGLLSPASQGSEASGPPRSPAVILLGGKATGK